MPASVVVAVVSTWAGAAIGTAIGASVLVGKIIGAVIGAVLSSALTKSKQRDIPAPSITQSDRTVTVRQAISPWQIIYGETRVGGSITHIESVRSGDTDTLHMVITFAGHVCSSIEAVYFDDEEVPDLATEAVGRYAGYVRIYKSLGDEAGQPFPDLVTASAGGWTDAHRQTGRTKLYVRMVFNREIFPNGVPNITAKIKGKKVYDPRTGLTTWSNNPALCVADYLMDDNYGLAHAVDELDEDALIAAANICDEAVPLAAGGTEARYTLDGSFEATAIPRDMIPRLLGAMQGTAVYQGGQWLIHAGAYITPTITLDESDFAGPVRVQTRLSRRDNFNAVKGIFVSPADLYQPTDFPPIVSSTFEAEDNGERVYQDVELNFTQRATVAQRIAKIQLLRARQPITVSGRLKLAAYRVAPPSTVKLSLEKFGWVEKVFEVLESTLVMDRDPAGAPVLVCDMVFRETAPSVWDWSTSEEQTLDPAPNSNLRSLSTVVAPGAITVAEELYQTRDASGVKARATVSWVASADPYVTSYRAEYKARADSEYIVQPLTTGTAFQIADIAPGDYDVRVRAVNILGIQSEYTTARFQVYGLSAAPAALEALTIQAVGGLAILQWTQSTDIDVLIGGRIDLRHSDDEAGTLWSEATPVGQALPGSASLVVLPLKSGTYFVRPYDSTGQAGDPVYVSTNAATALDYANVDSVTEDPGFSGATTGCVVGGGVLKLDGVGDVDSQADWDAIGNVDGIGGIAGSGSYLFSAGIDLGSVQRVRLTSRIAATVVAEASLIDSRAGDIDTWPNIDGDVDGDEAAAWVEFRRTNDNPAGSPMWSSWERLEQSEAYARAFEFRAQLRSYDTDFNVEVTGLAVSVDAVA